MSATHDSDDLHAPRYRHARDTGTVETQDGYHQPNGGTRRRRGCGCSLDTDKGAYRDVTVIMPDGRTLYYYHQSAVVVESADGERLRLDSHGYQTSTTKERINRHTPGGYHVVQRDYAWYLKTPDGERVEFIDGMVIEP
jgi:hypothetical protein